jgi:hypothetical protein
MRRRWQPIASACVLIDAPALGCACPASVAVDIWCTCRQEGEKLDKEALMREAISGQMKERQDLERKLQTQVRPPVFMLSNTS